MYLTFEDALLDIHTAWKESWFKYLFYFTNLAQILNTPTAPDAIDFLSAYLNSWWITRYYFQYFIEPKFQKYFHTHVALFLEIKSILIAHDLYYKENFKSISLLENIIDFVIELKDLANKKILTNEEYFLLLNRCLVLKDKGTNININVNVNEISNHNITFILEDDSKGDEENYSDIDSVSEEEYSDKQDFHSSSEEFDDSASDNSFSSSESESSKVIPINKEHHIHLESKPNLFDYSTAASKSHSRYNSISSHP